MNIALVILHADPARGGAERYTVDLSEALVDRGHEVSLLASSFGPAPGRARQVHIAAAGRSRVGRYQRFLDSLDAHLAAQRYDIVHAMLPVRRCDAYHPHAGLAAEAVACGHLKHRSTVARFVSRLGNRFNARRQRFAAIERELLSRAVGTPVVLCLSDYIKSTVRKHYPALPEAKLATLFNGIDLKKFDPAARPEAREEVRAELGLDAKRIVALIIAQDFARKGLREAILATIHVPDRRLVLVVVGKESPTAYALLVSYSKGDGRVVFAGSTSDPYAFYRAADLFVLPTRHDPCSLVVLEALAMGVPVVSTVFNGATEVMTDAVHGFVLPNPADIKALADRLTRMLDDEARQKMSAACLALRPQLSQERHVDRLIEIYSQARRDQHEVTKGTKEQ